MNRPNRRGFIAGTLLGATLALAGAAGADATSDEKGQGHMMQNGMMDGGMMQGGMMASMHKMMSQCSDMMASMQEKHDMQSGDGQSADDAS